MDADYIMNKSYQQKRLACEDMYDALWAAIELSDRTLPKGGRTEECQRVYDQCLAALNLAEGK